MKKLTSLYDCIKDDVKICLQKRGTYYLRAAKELKKKKTIVKLREELFDKYSIDEVVSRFEAPPGFWREIVGQKTDYIVQRPCGYINTGHKDYIATNDGDLVDVTDSGTF